MLEENPLKTILFAVLVILPIWSQASEREDPPANAPRASEVRDACARHNAFFQKHKAGFRGSCNDNSLEQLARQINQFTPVGHQACVKTVEFMRNSEGEYQEIINKGTRDAEALSASLGGKNLTQAQLMDASNAALRTQVQSFQQRNEQIRQTFAKHRDIHDLIVRIEGVYDRVLGQLNTPTGNHEGAYCPDGERTTFRTELQPLEREITALRKSVAGKVQALSQLYQRNLVAAGASEQQAITASRALLTTPSNGQALPDLEAQRQALPPNERPLSMNADGSIRGAENAWYQRVVGGPPGAFDRVGRVNCPSGHDTGTACYDFLDRNRNSRINDETLGLFTSNSLTGAAAQPQPPIIMNPQDIPGATAIRPGDILQAQAPAATPATPAQPSVPPTPGDQPVTRMGAQDYARDDQYKADTLGRTEMRPVADQDPHGTQAPQYIRDASGQAVPNRELASSFHQTMLSNEDYGSAYRDATASRTGTVTLQRWINSTCMNTYGDFDTSCSVTTDGVMGPRTQLQLYQLLNHPNPEMRANIQKSFREQRFR